MSDAVITFDGVSRFYAEVKKDMFYMKAHKYSSSVATALDANNIPVEVYHSLVDNVNANLGTFHRYLRLRQRMLGVEQLHYYDMYAPVVKNVDLTYSFEESQKHILASLAPLGPEYVSTAKEGLSNRWVDVYPNAGKRARAYSQGGAYDVHPYLLLNLGENYEGLTTFAHEWGHAMHSLL